MSRLHRRRASEPAAVTEVRHRAARLEDAVNRRVVTVLHRRGWTPRVLPYPGYGSAPTASDDGWVRVLARVLMTRTLPGEPSPEEEDEGHLVRGWRSFVTAPVAGARVRVHVGEHVHVAHSDRSGYLDVVVPADLAPGWHRVGLEVDVREGAPDGDDPADRDPDGDAARVESDVRVVGPEPSLGLVSDIDDTVMVTSLPRPLIAAWNTFVLHEHARRAVPGMAALYEAVLLAYDDGPVVYLSTGAWNVAPTLARFLRRHGYPPGPMLLTDWGPTNTGWFRSGQEHKRESLARLVRDLPQVRWLLVGDDGQHDPQIYAEMARRQPDRVAAIAIRQLTPAEQVLSHGLPVPVSGTEGAGVPVVAGPDGTVLAPKVRRVLRDRQPAGRPATGRPATG